MSWNSDDNMPGNVLNIHADVSIDTKLSMYEIRTYDIKHLSVTFHIARARRTPVVR